MTRLKTKSKEELIKDTRASAISFLEDCDHLIRITKKTETSPVDLRHASAILRRWIVEGTLQRVTSPRLGKLNVLAIDNNPVYREARKGKIATFVSGGAQIHGISIAAILINNGTTPSDLDNYHPDTLEGFSLETFAKQKVIYINETWITRREVIKFVANVAEGVHSGRPKEVSDTLLSELNSTLAVKLIENEQGVMMPQISHSVGQTTDERSLLDYEPTKVNGTLIELLATIHFLVSSPDVSQLRANVMSELNVCR